jgi:NADH-ubiquinone oxidoreductase chain 5
VALAHLVNHAIFKALLFLSAGAIIHALLDEQNLNKMGNLSVLFPLLYVFVLIGSCSLAGLPFLTGFYSKHMIMELSYATFSVNGVFICLLLYLGAIFTNIYSTRLLFKAAYLYNNSYKKYFDNFDHISISMMFVLILLTLGSIFFGYFLSDMFIGLGTSMFGNSLFVLEGNAINIECEYVPTLIKFVPLYLSFLSAALVALIYTKNIELNYLF